MNQVNKAPADLYAGYHLQFDSLYHITNPSNADWFAPGAAVLPIDRSQAVRDAQRFAIASFHFKEISKNQVVESRQEAGFKMLQILYQLHRIFFYAQQNERA